MHNTIKYLIRVELRDKLHDHPDFEQLIEGMERAGFKSYVMGVPDVDREVHSYQLPVGAFYCESDAPILTIRAKVKAIANAVDENNAVVVADCNRLVWADLMEIALVGQDL